MPILIAAMAPNRVIGTPQGMPWSVPAEYQQYLAFIRDQTVIMGRKTYEIFGADLTSRYAIVLSRTLSPTPEYEVVSDLHVALALAERQDTEEVFVAGGAQIYQQALSQGLIDEMYLSVIHGDYEGTAYFPDFDEQAWTVVAQQAREGFTFYHYTRQPRTPSACDSKPCAERS